MAFKASEVTTRARDALSDAVSPYRWDDPELWRYADDGVAQIVERHPESQYETEVSNSDPVPITGADDSITLLREYMEPLVHYVCFRALSNDSEDVSNHRVANDHLKNFVSFLS